MIRITQVLTALVLGILLLCTGHLALAAPAPAPAAPSVQTAPTPTPAAPSVKAAPTPRPDPFLGGDLSNSIPVTLRCREFGQCANLVVGSPCDTPVGCVCGYSGNQVLCGRF